MSEGYKRNDAGRDSPPPESSGAADIRGGDALRSLRSHNDSSRDRNSQRERERDRIRDRDRNGERGRDQDHNRDRDRNHRSRGGDRDMIDRRDSGRGGDSHDSHHTRDHDRRNSYGGDHGYESRSRGKFEPRTRHRSRSRSKSKRISGFDMTSSQSAMAPDAEVQGQILRTSAAIPYPPVMPQPMSQQATRHARRVYVGGLSLTANEQSVQTFFSQVMAAIGGNTFGPGDAVVNVYLNHEKKFAFVEMRSVEEASNAITLDGIVFEGAPVKVRRPSDYNPSLAALLGPSQPNPNLNLAAVGLTLRSASGLEGSDRVFVGGLPYYVMEAQVRELLESFGALRDFALVKDRETGNPKGYAFCIYHDLSVTDIACAALNGIRMGDKTLTVRRANQGTAQPRPEQESVLFQAHQHFAMQSIVFQGEPATKVLCLSNVVTVEELKEDELYEEIMEDMRGEAGKYGILVNVIIPRPSLKGEMIPGVGKVFLEYADVDGSTKARQGLHLRKFGGNEVTALYFPENTFAQGEYD